MAFGDEYFVTNFIFIIIYRMEKVNLRSTRSQIKIIGTLVSKSGAMIVTLTLSIRVLQ